MSLLSITPFPRSSLESYMMGPTDLSVMNSLAKELFNNSWDVSRLENPSRLAPLALDVKETETCYELLMDAPGIDKENTKIEIENHILTVSVEKKKNDVKETDKMKRIERSYGKTSRSLKLGEDVDENNVEASYVDGVLHVKLNKKPVDDESSKVKSITIN